MNTQPSESIAATAARSHVPRTLRHVQGRALLATMVALFACSGGAGGASDPTSAPTSAASSTRPATPLPDSFIVGDLGGAVVRIPRYFADNVEFDGDPGWGDRGGSEPKHRLIAAATLKSFGFKVRFPDMVGQSSPALIQERRSQSVFRSMWLGVGVNSGANFPGPGFLERRFSYINESGRQFRYQAQPVSAHGLAVYAPIGVDPKTGAPLRQHSDAEDIFIHRDSGGHIDAYISCSNRPHEAAPCRHDFSLEPQLKAQVYIIYRRGLLADWGEIQASVRSLILGFAQPPTEGGPKNTR